MIKMIVLYVLKLSQFTIIVIRFVPHVLRMRSMIKGITCVRKSSISQIYKQMFSFRSLLLSHLSLMKKYSLIRLIWLKNVHKINHIHLVITSVYNVLILLLSLMLPVVSVLVVKALLYLTLSNISARKFTISQIWLLMDCWNNRVQSYQIFKLSNKKSRMTIHSVMKNVHQKNLMEKLLVVWIAFKKRLTLIWRL